MSQSERAAAFRRLHDEGLLILANAWDAGTARLMQSLGAKAVATTSAGVAWAHGWADGIGMPLNLMAVPGLPDAEGLKALGVRRLSAGSSLSEAAFGLLRDRAGVFLATGDAAGLGEGAMPYPQVNGIMRTA